MARRTALIVGAASPATDIAEGLRSRDWSIVHVDDDRTAWTDDRVRELVAEAGADHLDLVVHARYPEISRTRRDLASLSVDDWTKAADEPLEAAIRLARGAHPFLAESDGTIVFLVPLMASAGGEGFAAMATAAEGIRILAKGLAKTWGADGIRAHAVTLDPSAFLSEVDAVGMAEANSLHDPPLGGVPDLTTEVAGIVEMLTSADARPLTGASLVVDGGLWMPG